MLEDPPPLEGQGPAWELSVQELQTALKGSPEDRQRLGLCYEELAKRAVYEYEKWMPRVLSWHDYQYNTFWYFGGSGEKDEGACSSGSSSKSFFSAAKENGRELFAEDCFFEVLARLAIKRLLHIHPISITYLVWTFARAGVCDKVFMEAVGDHFCDGLLPTLDRCSLGTIIWCFYQLSVPHKRLFQEAAAELMRPVRLRSLAPRNFQNVLIAYSRMQTSEPGFAATMARGMTRLLRGHDPRSSKCDRSLLFSYTCCNGDEVPADCFHISSLTIIARSYELLKAREPEVEDCYEAMADYVLRSIDRSPPKMREPGDAAQFALALARCAEGLPRIERLLDKFLDRLPDVCRGAPQRTLNQLWEALQRAGADAPT